MNSSIRLVTCVLGIATAMLIGPTIAEAHTATSSASCTAATINWDGFASSGSGNGGQNSPTWSMTFTPSGGSASTISGQVSFAGASSSITKSLPGVNGTLVLQTAWTSSQTRDGNAASYSKTYNLTGCTPPPADSCGYPSGLGKPGTTFVENEVLRAISSQGVGLDTKIMAWYSDEHAMTLGKNPGVTPMSPTTAPNHAVNPSLGDLSAVDASGRPLYPAAFITDITSNPSSKSGDWQQVANNSSAQAPQDVFGTWKAAGAADPTANSSYGAGADPAPSGITYEAFRTEVRWSASSLTAGGQPLIPGHTYRVQVLVQDGDQLRQGGDAGEACSNITIPKAQPSISTSATKYVAAGGSISDSAHLSNGASPTGKIAFRVYADDACTGDGTLVSTNDVDGSGNATSAAYTPATADTYYWRAFYLGDDHNSAVSGACKAANEDSLVATPHLTIVKEVSSDGGSTWHKSVTVHTGDVVKYRFTVTNDGDAGTNLTGVHINELTVQRLPTATARWPRRAASRATSPWMQAQASCAATRWARRT